MGRHVYWEGGSHAVKGKKRFFITNNPDKDTRLLMLEVSGGWRKHTSAKHLSSSQHRCSKFHIMRRPQQGATNRVSTAIQGAELGHGRQAELHLQDYTDRPL